jgi:hypothetical protein
MCRPSRLWRMASRITLTRERLDSGSQQNGRDRRKLSQQYRTTSLAANACLSVGYAANAAAMGIELERLEIETEGQLDLRGFLGLDSSIKPGYEEVRYTVRIKSAAPHEKLVELHQSIMKTSPNFSNFATAIRMIPNLVVDNSYCRAGVASTHSMCQITTLPTSSYQRMYQRRKP